MAWRWPCNKPSSEPMMIRLPTHKYASLGLNELTTSLNFSLFVLIKQLDLCADVSLRAAIFFAIMLIGIDEFTDVFSELPRCSSGQRPPVENMNAKWFSLAKFTMFLTRFNSWEAKWNKIHWMYYIHWWKQNFQICSQKFCWVKFHVWLVAFVNKQRSLTRTVPVSRKNVAKKYTDYNLLCFCSKLYHSCTATRNSARMA